LTTPLLVATRSDDKLREIRQILGDLAGHEVLGLRDAGILPAPEEEGLERFDTFEENAMAKARYFAEVSGMATLADDSGLCVDALDGRPGVRSKRYSGRGDLAGGALDAANNARLVGELAGVPTAKRSARYVCVVALVDSGGEEKLFRGEFEGSILEAPRGEGGFGYDPLFHVPEEGRTVGELPPERKNLLSHRSAAVRAAAKHLHGSGRTAGIERSLG
jgi:XTP/dITP diphosphohydrolase